MLELLDHIDKEAFLYFNRWHSDTSDIIWQTITNPPTWVPLYIILVIILITTFKKDSIYLILGVLFVILVSDQFTSSFMKPFFERLRPCHNPEIGSMVHVVKACGGQYGFASGHAANSFGIAMFIWMSFRSFWSGTWIMFFWAFLVAFSRIMVGVHYPGDIIIGGILGIVFGWLIFKFTEEIYFRVRLLPLIRN